MARNLNEGGFVFSNQRVLDEIQSVYRSIATELGHENFEFRITGGDRYVKFVKGQAKIFSRTPGWGEVDGASITGEHIEGRGARGVDFVVGKDVPDDVIRRAIDASSFFAGNTLDPQHYIDKAALLGKKVDGHWHLGLRGTPDRRNWATNYPLRGAEPTILASAPTAPPPSVDAGPPTSVAAAPPTSVAAAPAVVDPRARNVIMSDAQGDPMYAGLVPIEHQVYDLRQRLEGRVLEVLDGDTVVFDIGGKPTKVRLNLMDAPETGQGMAGANSTAALAAMLKAGGNVAQIISSGEDVYGRTIGDLYVGGMNLNEELVRSGNAWTVPGYGGGTRGLQMEQAARDEGIGMFAGGAQGGEPPHLYRARHREENAKKFAEEADYWQKRGVGPDPKQGMLEHSIANVEAEMTPPPGDIPWAAGVRRQAGAYRQMEEMRAGTRDNSGAWNMVVSHSTMGIVQNPFDPPEGWEGPETHGLPPRKRHFDWWTPLSKTDQAWLAPTFENVDSIEDYEWRFAQNVQDMKDIQELADAPWYKAMAAEGFGALIDPVGAVANVMGAAWVARAVGSVGRTMFWRTAKLNLLAGGAAASAQEIALQHQQFLRTREESVFNIVAGAIGQATFGVGGTLMSRARLRNMPATLFGETPGRFGGVGKPRAARGQEAYLNWMDTADRFGPSQGPVGSRLAARREMLHDAVNGAPGVTGSRTRLTGGKEHGESFDPYAGEVQHFTDSKGKPYVLLGNGQVLRKEVFDSYPRKQAGEWAREGPTHEPRAPGSVYTPSKLRQTKTGSGVYRSTEGWEIRRQDGEQLPAGPMPRRLKIPESVPLREGEVHEVGAWSPEGPVRSKGPGRSSPVLSSEGGWSLRQSKGRWRIHRPDGSSAQQSSRTLKGAMKKAEQIALNEGGHRARARVGKEYHKAFLKQVEARRRRLRNPGRSTGWRVYTPEGVHMAHFKSLKDAKAGVLRGQLADEGLSEGSMNQALRNAHEDTVHMLRPDDGTPDVTRQSSIPVPYRALQDDTVGGQMVADDEALEALLDPSSTVKPGEVDMRQLQHPDAVLEVYDPAFDPSVRFTRESIVGFEFSNALGANRVLKHINPGMKLASSPFYVARKAGAMLGRSPFQYVKEKKVWNQFADPAVNPTSVYQRWQARHDAMAFQFQREMDTAFSSYHKRISGAGPLQRRLGPRTGAMWQSTKDVLSRRRPENREAIDRFAAGEDDLAWDSLDFSNDELRELLTWALDNGDVHGIPEIQALAQWTRKNILDPVADDLERLGQLSAKDRAVKPGEKGNLSYFQRVWNQPKVIAHTDELATILSKHWIEQEPMLLIDQSGAKRTPDVMREEIYDEAWQTARRIAGDGGRIEYHFAGDATMKARMVDIPHEKVAKFLERDAGVIVDHYMRTYLPDIELLKAFPGASHANDVAALISKQLGKELQLIQGDAPDVKPWIMGRFLGGKKWTKTQLAHEKAARDIDIRYMVDEVRGRRPGGTRDANEMYTGFSIGMRVARMSTTAAVGGKFMLASLSDPANIKLRNDWWDIYEGAFRGIALRRQSLVLESSQALRELGLMFESHNGARAQKYVDGGDHFNQLRNVERVMGNVSKATMWANGLTPWNQTWKAVVGSIAANRARNGVLHHVGDLKLSKSRGRKAARWLAENGIDDRMAERIAAQIRKHGDVDSKNWVVGVNSLEWDDAAATRAFGMAILREIDLTINTPSAGERPWAMVTSEVVKTGAIYKLFSMINMGQRVIPIMQRASRREWAVISDIGIMLAMGSLALWVRMVVAGKDPSALSPREYFENTVDVVGIFGTAGEAYSFGRKLMPDSSLVRMGDLPVAEHLGGATFGHLMVPVRAVMEQDPWELERGLWWHNNWVLETVRNNAFGHDRGRSGGSRFR